MAPYWPPVTGLAGEKWQILLVVVNLEVVGFEGFYTLGVFSSFNVFMKCLN